MAFCVPCQAGSSEPQVMPVVEWVIGPTNVALGKAATLQVPPGYTFTYGKGAQAVLKDSSNTSPKGVVGLMRSDYQGGWMTVFTYDETGFISDPAQASINADAMLKKTAEQPGISKAVWKMPPQFDAAGARLVWAVEAEKSDQKVKNYNAWLLGRQGILKITTVYSGFTDDADFKQLISGVSFIPGQQYADHQNTDQLAKLGLAELALLTDEGAAAEPQLDSKLAGLRVIALWVGVPGIGIAVVAMVAMGLRRTVRARIPKPVPAEMPIVAESKVEAETPATPVAQAPVAKASSAAPAVAAPRKEAKAKSAPGHEKNGKPLRGFNGHQNANRRREFDYNRYFADLMSTVSSHGLALENAASNRFGQEQASEPPANNGNGSLNGHGNNGNGHSAPLKVNSELIASQNSFIEEQRRLIQEQAKLIEEKSKLIAEKNQLLQLQRELLDHKLL